MIAQLNRSAPPEVPPNRSLERCDTIKKNISFDLGKVPPELENKVLRGMKSCKLYFD